MTKIQILVLLITLPLLVSCKSDREVELEANLANLNEKLDTVRTNLDEAESELDDLKMAIGGMSSTLDEFDNTDWQVVVDRARSEAYSIQSAADSVDEAISHAKIAAE